MYGKHVIFGSSEPAETQKRKHRKATTTFLNPCQKHTKTISERWDISSAKWLLNVGHGPSSEGLGMVDTLGIVENHRTNAARTQNAGINEVSNAGKTTRHPAQQIACAWPSLLFKNVANSCQECVRFMSRMCQLHFKNLSKSGKECCKFILPEAPVFPQKQK